MVAGNDNMLYSIVIVLTPTREATVRATRLKGTGDAAAPRTQSPTLDKRPEPC